MKNCTANKPYNFYPKTGWKSWQKTAKHWWILTQPTDKARQQTRQWVVDIKMRYKWRVSRECSWCNDARLCPGAAAGVTRPLGWIISDGINYPPPWLDYFYYRARPSPRSHQQQQPLITTANRFQMLIASPRLGGGDGSWFLFYCKVHALTALTKLPTCCLLTLLGTALLNLLWSDIDLTISLNAKVHSIIAVQWWFFHS